MAEPRRRRAGGLDRLIVKFRGLDNDAYGAYIVQDDGKLYAEGFSLDGFYQVLPDQKDLNIRLSYSLDAKEMRAFQETIQEESGRKFPFLNLYVRVVPPPDTDLRALADALKRIPEVERVSLSGPLVPPQGPVDFTSDQLCHRPASDFGIDVHHAWQCPGGAGDEVTVCDCEWGFNPNHVDLPAIPVLHDPDGNLNVEINHGTMSLGVLGASDQPVPGYAGVTGICHRATVKFSSISATNTPISSDDYSEDAIQKAVDDLSAGDVLLLELSVEIADEVGIPIEWREDIRDLIDMAVTKGITVVQAAGNVEAGGTNLADYTTEDQINPPVAGVHLWDPGRPAECVDTGSIIVGAGWAFGNQNFPPRAKRKTSNFGRRIDCQGWGSGILTTGADGIVLYSEDSDHCWAYYRDTSAAAAMVAGAVACLQGAAKRTLGGPLTPATVRALLRDPDNGSYQPGNEPANRVGGQPQPGSDADKHWIGSLPDLKKIFDEVGVFADVFLRDSIGDSGQAPLNDPRCAGPDIIPRIDEVADPDAELGPPSWDEPALGVNMALDESRHIYLRGRNRGTVTDRGNITLYWSRPSTYLHPSLWHRIDRVNFGPSDSGDHFVLDPIHWNPDPNGRTGPAALITVVRSRRNRTTVPGRGSSTEEYLDFIHGRNDIRARCVWTLNTAPGDFTEAFRMELRGLRDRNAEFRFEIHPRVPRGTLVELAFPEVGAVPGLLPANLADPSVFRHAFTGNQSLAVNGVSLREKARIPVDVRFGLPVGSTRGRYSIALDQFWNNVHLGRLTIRLRS